MKTMDRTITSDHISEDLPDNYHLLIASLLFLMTRYARRPETTVARGIIDHLDRLSRYPGTDLVIKNCQRLIRQWSDVALYQSPQGCRTCTDTTLH